MATAPPSPAPDAEASPAALAETIDAKSTTPVTVRILTGGSVTATYSFVAPGLKQEAMRWSYIVSNRKRWAESRESTALAERARQALEAFRLDRDHLRALARAELIEVSVPYEREERGWEARIFPWEPVLAGAAKSLGAEQPLTVVRHLERKQFGAPTPHPRPLERLLFVIAAPPEVQKVYSFDFEQDQVTKQLGFGPGEVRTLVFPTREGLRRATIDFRPDVVHLAGADVWQVAEMLGWPDREGRRDGVVLAGEERYDEVDPEGLADLLVAADPPPRLLASNVWNSAARIGAMAVARGVGAAVGFQDVFDDARAETFFSDFYRALRLSGHDELTAFRTAQEALQAQPQRVTGSGVVLWRERSIAEEPWAAPPSRPAGGRKRGARAPSRVVPEAAPPPSDRTAEAVRQQFLAEKEKPHKGGSARDLIGVEVKPLDHINYSLLHNNRGLFEKFEVKNNADGALRDVTVEVMLYVGSDSFPYAKTFDLRAGEVRPLHDEVRVPLTSALGRGLRESLRTSLRVRGTWNDQVFFHDTLSVMLLAVDEWRDTKLDNRWLPSFVLPRDPVVSRVVDAAQKYLMVLRDDTSAGFDGYQGLDPSAEDPAEAVDLQVRAIWSGLMLDSPLSYINPPPTYTRSSQRLRTPSDVIAGRRGTCIDLALLLAACLEYVDIYPVIFLLKGHCFPGYWRSEAAHDRFIRMDTSTTPGGAAALGPTATARGLGGPGQTEPWYLDENHYAEVVDLVHAGDLVPIETVWLTSRGSFWDAIDEGIKDLRSKDDFDAMIDLKRARERDVTPLPLHGGDGR